MLTVTQDFKAHLLSAVDESLYIKKMIQSLFLISFLYLANNLINSSGISIASFHFNVNLLIGIMLLFIYSFFEEVLYASYDEFLDTILLQVIEALLGLSLYYLFPVLSISQLRAHKRYACSLGRTNYRGFENV